MNDDACFHPPQFRCPIHQASCRIIMSLLLVLTKIKYIKETFTLQSSTGKSESERDSLENPLSPAGRVRENYGTFSKAHTYTEKTY